MALLSLGCFDVSGLAGALEKYVSNQKKSSGHGLTSVHFPSEILIFSRIGVK